MFSDQFYELGPGGSGDPCSAMPEVPLSYSQEQALALGEWQPPDPLVFRQNSYKRTPGHFVPGGSPALTLVSGTLIEALQRSA